MRLPTSYFFCSFFSATQNRQYFCTTQKELRTSLLPLEKFCGKTALRDFYAAVVGWQYSPQSMGNYDDYSMNLPESGKITRPMGEQQFCPRGSCCSTYWVVQTLSNPNLPTSKASFTLGY